MRIQRSFKERWMQHQRQLNPQPAVSLPEHSSNTPQSFDSNQHRLSQIQSAAGQAEQPAGLEELSQSLSQSFMSYYSQFSRRMATSTQNLCSKATPQNQMEPSAFPVAASGHLLASGRVCPETSSSQSDSQHCSKASFRTPIFACKAEGQRCTLATPLFSLSAADVAAQNTENAPSPAWTAAVMTLSALGAAVPEKAQTNPRRAGRATGTFDLPRGSGEIWKWQLGNQWPQQRTADHPTERGQPRIKP